MSTSRAIPRGDPTSQAIRPVADRASNTVRTAGRTIALLCVFAHTMPTCSTIELGERLGPTKSTARCLFPALMGRRLATRIPFRRHSSLDYRFLALATVIPGVPAEAERRSVCQPYARGRREVATGT